MKNSKVLKAYLIVSGLLLTFIGGATLIKPVFMKGNAGIDVAGQISVINDIRASGAFILAIAILSLLGAFIKRLTYTSVVALFTLFIALGIGRLMSILIDGMPVEGLVHATLLEFVLGIMGAILFGVYKDKA